MSAVEQTNSDSRVSPSLSQKALPPKLNSSENVSVSVNGRIGSFTFETRRNKTRRAAKQSRAERRELAAAALVTRGRVVSLGERERARDLHKHTAIANADKVWSL